MLFIVSVLIIRYVIAFRYIGYPAHANSNSRRVGIGKFVSVNSTSGLRAGRAGLCLVSRLAPAADWP